MDTRDDSLLNAVPLDAPLESNLTGSDLKMDQGAKRTAELDMEARDEVMKATPEPEEGIAGKDRSHGEKRGAPGKQPEGGEQVLTKDDQEQEKRHKAKDTEKD